MSYRVVLTEDAAKDLEELHSYISDHDSPGKTASLLDRIERSLKSLAEHPERGSYPKELLDLGLREYRQVFFKPYRIIYRQTEKIVYVYLIVDGRRDMQTLLQQRLLRA